MNTNPPSSSTLACGSENFLRSTCGKSHWQTTFLFVPSMFQLQPWKLHLNSLARPSLPEARSFVPRCRQALK